MNCIKQFISRPTRKKKGQGMVEYALLISFIALALVIALKTMGNGLFEFFKRVTDIIQG